MADAGENEWPNMMVGERERERERGTERERERERKRENLEVGEIG